MTAIYTSPLKCPPSLKQQLVFFHRLNAIYNSNVILNKSDCRTDMGKTDLDADHTSNMPVHLLAHTDTQSTALIDPYDHPTYIQTFFFNNTSTADTYYV